ncbi:hypothetical protein, partial [Streptomyces buecherae]|uniref:hypothetical protein n=1 Tax=Streptomyces buecherae TaxID=2763006 RepID=UPI0036F3B424
MNRRHWATRLGVGCAAVILASSEAAAARGEGVVGDARTVGARSTPTAAHATSAEPAGDAATKPPLAPPRRHAQASPRPGQRPGLGLDLAVGDGAVSVHARHGGLCVVVTAGGITLTIRHGCCHCPPPPCPP